MKKLFTILCLILVVNFMAYSQTLIYPKLSADKITDIHFLSESDILLVNSGGSIYKSYDGGNNWKLIKHYQGESLLSINFINEATGFILPSKPANFAAPSLKYTIDRGETWNEHSISISGINDFIPLSENTSLKATWNGQIHRLNNFYNNWDTVYTMPTYTIDDPEFGEYEVPFGSIIKFHKLSNNSVLALGSNESAFDYGIIHDSLSFILKTKDAGVSWDTLWVGSNKIINDFIFFNDQIGWMCNSSNIYKTQDGGNSWYELLPDSSFNNINNLFCTSENVLYFTSNYNHKLYKITEPNLTVESLVFNQNISGINFFSDNYGLLFGTGLDLFSGNDLELSIIHNPIKDVINDIKFLNKLIGFTAGYNGVYKTLDGGVTWEKKLETPNHNSGQLAISAQKTFWYIKYDSIYKSFDLGESWEQITLSSRSQLYNGIEFYDNNLGIIYGVSEEENLGSRVYSTKYNYITLDGGENWTPILIDSVFKDVNFKKAKFTDSEHIFLIGDNGLWLSKDTSKTWECIYGVDYFNGNYTFDFYNPKFGVLFTNYNESYVTVNGGITWNMFTKPIGTSPNDCIIIGPNYDNEFIRVLEVGDNGKLNLYYFDDNGIVTWSRQLTTFTKSFLTSLSILEQNYFPNIWIGSANFNILYREYEKLPTDVKINLNSLPTSFSLSQNYPNPFNPTTTIEYSVPSSSVISHPLAGERSQSSNKNEISPSGRNDNHIVSLKVYDLLGREVKILVNQQQNPGKYSVQFNAENLTSGIYYYQLRTGNYSETKKMILLR